MPSTSFTFRGLGLRLLFALVLVFATYNPHGYSYYDWVVRDYQRFQEMMPLKIFAGVILLIGWTIFLRATLRSLGAVGILLALAFFGSLVWLLVYYDLVPKDDLRVTTYLIEAVIVGILAVGMSWSHIRRRLTGQADVDEVDEG